MVSERGLEFLSVRVCELTILGARGAVEGPDKLASSLAVRWITMMLKGAQGADVETTGLP